MGCSAAHLRLDFDDLSSTKESRSSSSSSWKRCTSRCSKVFGTLRLQRRTNVEAVALGIGDAVTPAPDVGGYPPKSYDFSASPELLPPPLPARISPRSTASSTFSIPTPPLSPTLSPNKLHRVVNRFSGHASPAGVSQQTILEQEGEKEQDEQDPELKLDAGASRQAQVIDAYLEDGKKLGISSEEALKRIGGALLELAGSEESGATSATNSHIADKEQQELQEVEEEWIPPASAQAPKKRTPSWQLPCSEQKAEKHRSLPPAGGQPMFLKGSMAAATPSAHPRLATHLPLGGGAASSGAAAKPGMPWEANAPTNTGAARQAPFEDSLLTADVAPAVAVEAGSSRPADADELAVGPLPSNSSSDHALWSSVEVSLALDIILEEDDAQSVGSSVLEITRKRSHSKTSMSWPWRQRTPDSRSGDADFAGTSPKSDHGVPSFFKGGSGGKSPLESWQESTDEQEGETSHVRKGRCPSRARVSTETLKGSGAFRAKSPTPQSALLEALASSDTSRGRSRGTRSASSREKEDLRHIRSLNLDSLEMLPRELAPRKQSPAFRKSASTDAILTAGSSQSSRTRRRERSLTPPPAPLVARRNRGPDQMFSDSELVKNRPSQSSLD
eukprot:TRINITY_DN44963_c0_g1_i1.p1 TRINITY_DN44963_c0_g1~~TRINITY_DN44963_c0_g1_i1.p1  ORF type:complete len:617 (-),score=114.74 TRINITY_DN44963_c0_g1_i1:91-1941(-)